MESNLDDKVRADAVDQLIETRTEPPQIAHLSLTVLDTCTYVRMLPACKQDWDRGGIGRWRLFLVNSVSGDCTADLEISWFETRRPLIVRCHVPFV